MEQTTPIPLKYVGPLKIIGSDSYEVKVPLATYEYPLWPSVNRGANVTRHSGGIRVVVQKEGMSRSVLFDAETACEAARIVLALESHRADLFKVAEETSRYLRCTDVHYKVVGSCIFLRLTAMTGDAAGHNMVTKAADAVLAWICHKFPSVKHVSVSGNFCTDKKVSAVNSILGRGKTVIAEALLPQEICEKLLKTSPEKLVELNIKKNLVGSIINGGVASANAHFANMLLALYLATGQDAANIVEGSQGITFAEVRDTHLYFSVTLPSVIVGTVGPGKDLPFVQEALQKLGCLESREIGSNARRLAEIVGATVLCGELSCLAAQTRPGELMRTHMAIERPRRTS